MKQKKELLSFLLLMIMLGLSSCDWLNPNKEITDPSKTMGKVGNYWTATVPDAPDAKITINSNSNGNVIATIPYNGVNYEVEGKITDNGFSDYVYSNGDKSKPYTLVKFDANVGDKWEYKIGNQTVTREVVKKSTTDDTSYGFWLVKTIDVLETVPAGLMINGAVGQLKSGTIFMPDNNVSQTKSMYGNVSQVKTILWKFNHKFGFIAAEITKTDNTKVIVSQIDTNVATL
jgi:hypothetical protein